MLLKMKCVSKKICVGALLLFGVFQHVISFLEHVISILVFFGEEHVSALLPAASIHGWRAFFRIQFSFLLEGLLSLLWVYFARRNVLGVPWTRLWYITRDGVKAPRTSVCALLQEAPTFDLYCSLVTSLTTEASHIPTSDC